MNQWQTGRGGPGLAFGGLSMTPAVKGLLIANVAVYLLSIVVRQFSGGDYIGFWGAFIPQLAILKLQVWRFITYMFLHDGMWHLLFNMFGLWMFGSQVEAIWGKRTFLVYYFVCGLGGAVVYGLFNLTGQGSLGGMVGASGAVFGILLAYGMTFPNRIILFMFIIPMKAKYFVVIFGLIELLSIPTQDNVARLAHLGGMLAGFIFLRVTAPNLRAGSSLGGLGGPGGIQDAWRRFQTKRRMRVVKPDKKSKGDSGGHKGKGDRGSDPEIDRILDKISRKGLQSLTDDEQEVLRRAGRK